MAVLKRVGFVGIGRMGYPMAGHIVEAGFDVTVSDMDKEPVDRFVENYNANSAENLTALSRDVDVIITMLPTSKIVREVVLGDGKGDCLHRGLTRGQILIDASTSNPITTQEIGKELEKDGIEMIDAPVAGGVVFAVNGTLDVMVGGNQETINRCKPLFEAIGGNTVYCGSLGSGHAVKVLNNFVNASTLISLIEALVLGCKFGLDINMMVESMMAATTGRNHPIQKKIVPHILTRKFESGMDLSLLAKDTRIMVDIAEAIEAYAPISKQCSELWRAAADQIGNFEDQTCAVKLWEKQNGVKLDLRE